MFAKHAKEQEQHDVTLMQATLVSKSSSTKTNVFLRMCRENRSSKRAAVRGCVTAS